MSSSSTYLPSPTDPLPDTEVDQHPGHSQGDSQWDPDLPRLLQTISQLVHVTPEGKSKAVLLQYKMHPLASSTPPFIHLSGCSPQHRLSFLIRVLFLRLYSWRILETFLKLDSDFSLLWNVNIVACHCGIVWMGGSDPRGGLRFLSHRGDLHWKSVVVM